MRDTVNLANYLSGEVTDPKGEHTNATYLNQYIFKLHSKCSSLYP